jgi:hypothetical protein
VIIAALNSGFAPAVIDAAEVNLGCGTTLRM